MRTAVITASYAGDFERCRLLCDSLDSRLAGDWTHYILVEHRDVQQFSALAGQRRHIIDEREILPSWLRPFPDPLAFGRRRIWMSPFVPPLRGWHVQQLRRLGVARLLSEPAMFSADSDVVLMREFDPESLWQDGDLRLYCQPGANTPDMSDHCHWAKAAHRLLVDGPVPAPPYDNYINTLIGWRTDTAKALLDYIERRSGTDWVRATARTRAISECTIYGQYVDSVLGGTGHFHSSEALCQVMWTGQADKKNSGQDLRAFIKGMESHQIGIGIQSFIGYDLKDIRQLVLP